MSESGHGAGGCSDCGKSGGEGAERQTAGFRDGAARVRLAEFWRRETVSRNLLALSDGQVVGQDVYERERALFDAAGAKVVGRPRPATSHKVTQYILSGAEVLETVEVARLLERVGSWQGPRCPSRRGSW